MKKFLCTILAFSMCAALCMPVFAASSDEILSEDLIDESIVSDFSSMSTEELNRFIHSLSLLSAALDDEAMFPDFSGMSIEELNDLIHTLSLLSTAVDEDAAAPRANAISLAWIAAAEIASNSGYPCAGTVVKFSALGEDYIESNGLLAETIQTTDAFSAWKSELGDYIVFEKSDNSDLFYAIHNANISLTGNSSGARARVTDIFDFELETDMGDLFSTLVNDWGWLSQNIGALSAINIQVDIRL